MKKLFAGFIGLLLVSGGINSALAVTTAATNKSVEKVINVTEEGVANDTTADGFRKGVGPQTNRLDNARGDEVSQATINATAIGNVAAGSISDPTKSINGNSANIEVLERDKLVAPRSYDMEFEIKSLGAPDNVFTVDKVRNALAEYKPNVFDNGGNIGIKFAAETDVANRVTEILDNLLGSGRYQYLSKTATLNTNCALSTDTCGYITTANHDNIIDNSIENKKWVRFTRCTGSGNSITCEN